MNNSRKLAERYLKEFENVEKAVFVRKNYSKTTKSRYYQFYNKSEDDKLGFEYEILIVRISDHGNRFENSFDFEGHHVSVDDQEYFDSLEEAKEYLELN